MAEEQSKPDAGGTDQLAGLKSRLDELQNLFKQWEAARSAAFRTRVGVIVVVLLVIIFYGWNLYSTFGQVQDPEYQAELMTKVNEAGVVLMNRAGEDVLAAASRLRPVYEEAARQEIQENRDAMVEKVKEEVATLGNNLADKLEGQLKGKVYGGSKILEAKVREAFPQLQDDQDVQMVVENLQQALSDAAYDVMAERIQGAEADLQEVAEDIIALLPEDRRAGFRDRLNFLFENFMLQQHREQDLEADENLLKSEDAEG